VLTKIKKPFIIQINITQHYTQLGSDKQFQTIGTDYPSTHT